MLSYNRQNGKVGMGIIIKNSSVLLGFQTANILVLICKAGLKPHNLPLGKLLPYEYILTFISFFMLTSGIPKNGEYDTLVKNEASDNNF